MPEAPLEHYLADEAETVVAGRALGQTLADATLAGAIIYLEGVLGAGKTTFCRGVLRAFGHEGAVKSPTYTLVEPYELDGHRLYHFDLYRLGDPEELEYMGARDYFRPGSLCLIEWPERGGGFLPAADLIAKVSVAAPGRRLLLQAATPNGATLLEQFRQKHQPRK